MSVKNKLSIYKEFTLHLSTLYSVTLKMSSMSKAPSTVHYKQSLPSTRIVEEENRLSSERARVKIPRDGRYSLTPSLKEKGAARDFFVFALQKTNHLRFQRLIGHFCEAQDYNFTPLHFKEYVRKYQIIALISVVICKWMLGQIVYKKLCMYQNIYSVNSS